MKRLLLIYFSLLSFSAATTRITMVRNAKVIAYEEIVHPAEMESGSEGFPSLTVFLDDAEMVRTPAAGKPVAMTVKRGDVLYRGPRDGKICATGTMEVRFVRIEFCGAQSGLTWDRSGLAPEYKLLFENGYGRAYDIHIPAGTSEPQHTHHDRVVVCLSGARLRHILPDGHEEDSTLKTGECLWRRRQTHIGSNIGKTDLWVIAVEPK